MSVVTLQDHSGSHGIVGFLIDEDEAAGVAVDRIGIGKEGQRGAQADASDFIHAQPEVLLVFMERVDVDLVPDFLDQGLSLIHIFFNIRNASVTPTIGVIALELEGDREEIKKAVAWLEANGVQVEPVEINTIEG